MISDPERLLEVVEEIMSWSLQERRDYIANIAKAFGQQAAQQIRDALTELWRLRK
jgi:hypothetical protein